MVRNQCIDAPAEVLVGGMLKAREVLRHLDVMSAYALRILIYEARYLNSRKQPDCEERQSKISS